MSRCSRRWEIACAKIKYELFTSLHCCCPSFFRRQEGDDLIPVDPTIRTMGGSQSAKRRLSVRTDGATVAHLRTPECIIIIGLIVFLSGSHNNNTLGDVHKASLKVGPINLLEWRRRVYTQLHCILLLAFLYTESI